MAKLYDIQIVSISEPIGHAPYVLHLNPYSQNTSKQYASKGDLFRDLSECVPGAVPKGIMDVIGTIAEKGIFTTQANLTDDQVIRLATPA
jgi:hypothetical protein